MASHRNKITDGVYCFVYGFHAIPTYGRKYAQNDVCKISSISLIQQSYKLTHGQIKYLIYRFDLILINLGNLHCLNFVFL